MAIHIVPTIEGGQITHLDLRFDREGIRRLVRFVFAGGTRKYSMKVRLAARAVGWANRYTGLVKLPIEYSVDVAHVSDADRQMGEALRDVLLAEGRKLAASQLGLQKSDGELTGELANFLRDLFSREGDSNMRAEILNTGIFDKETKEFLSDIDLDGDRPIRLACAILGLPHNPAATGGPA